MTKRKVGKKKTENKLAQRALGPMADRFGRSAAKTGIKAAGAVDNLVEGTALLSGVLLRAVKVLVYGWDQLERRFFPMVEERVATIPEERRIAPPISIAGPTIEAAKFTTDEPELSRMFANLLATAMDSETAMQAHPSFVEIIKQLTPDEAKIIKRMGEQPYAAYPVIDVQVPNQDGSGWSPLLVDFSHVGRAASVSDDSKTPSGLVNLCRLGVCEIPAQTWLSDDTKYDDLRNDPLVKELAAKEQAKFGRSVQFARRAVQLSTLGRRFVSACVVDRSNTSTPA